MAPCCKYMNRRAKNGEAYAPTPSEHFANVITHGFAVIPALIYCRNLLQSATSDEEYRNGLLFGAATTSLFISSTAYHWVFFVGKWQDLRVYLHKIDRAAIYIFIAASYTPWLMLKEVGNFGSMMRWIVWLLALCGMIYQYLYHEKYKLIEILIYLFTGVFPAAAVLSMEERSGLQFLAYGGIIYIIGVIFFKCDGLIPYAHAIWHLHVVAGVSFHYYAIHMYLMGRGDSHCNSLRMSVMHEVDTKPCVL